MLGRVLGWLGLGGGDTDEVGDLDWTDPDTEYGGDGPTRRYAAGGYRWESDPR